MTERTTTMDGEHSGTREVAETEGARKNPRLPDGEEVRERVTWKPSLEKTEGTGGSEYGWIPVSGLGKSGSGSPQQLEGPDRSPCFFSVWVSPCTTGS